MSRMGRGGEDAKFPNKDRLQRGLASPGEDYPGPQSQAPGPGTGRDWFYSMIIGEHSALGNSFKASGEPVLVFLRCQCTIRNVNTGAMDSQGQKPKHPEGHWDSNKEESGRGKFRTFSAFSAGKSWMEKPLLNVLSVPFRRTSLTFTQTLSLSTEKQRVCFICLLRCPEPQHYIKWNRKGASRVQHTELLTVVISE